MRNSPIRSDLKTTLAGLVIQDDGVKQSWDEVSRKWEPDEARILFSMITELWITVQGFGYASQQIKSGRRKPSH